MGLRQLLRAVLLLGSDGCQHPINDIPGAARRIAERVRPDDSQAVTP